MKHCNDSKAFMEYSNTVGEIYHDINDYHPNRSRKILIVYKDIIADMNTNKKVKSIVKKLFIRCRKLNISLAFITQSYYLGPKDAELNSKHYLMMNS